jgi:hypothetical protein
MQEGSLTEDKGYNSSFERHGPGLSSKSKTCSQKTPVAFKMMTAVGLRRRLEALECDPGVQETKIFFIDEGSD